MSDLPDRVPETPSALVADERLASEQLSRGAAIARELQRLVESQGLAVRLGGSSRPHVRCEGWTALAAMLGLAPREVEVREVEDGRYVATVELVRVRDGAVVSRASAECGPDEPAWANRPRYARRSMSITRATSKACRLALSWIAVLAGYEATPAEEVVEGEVVAAEPAPQPKPERRETRRRAAGDVISEAQRRRLWAIAMQASGERREVAEQALRDVLESHGVESSRAVPRDAYDVIVEEVRLRAKEIAEESVAIGPDDDPSAGFGSPAEDEHPF